MWKYLAPLGIFIVMVVFLAIGLKLNPKEVPSPFIGKPAPEFSLPLLHKPDIKFSPQQMKGQVWLLNVWASWCVSCRAEHPVLNNLVRTQTVNLIGLNYKDASADAKDWLKHLGDPYQLSVIDLDGRIGIDWGVYGVPETFVIDKQGFVRYKHIGPVRQEDLDKIILPLIKQLESAS